MTNTPDTRYHALMQHCENEMCTGFSALLRDMIGHIDNDLLERSEQAPTNEMRNRYQETLYEFQRHKESMEALFLKMLRDGFFRFASGATIGSENKEPSVPRQRGRLSLVETEQYERELAINQVVQSASNRFVSALYALNRRLAVVNGGTKISETSGAFPVGPKHLCDAFVSAIEPMETTTAIEIELIGLFDHHVISHAEPLYKAFNKTMSTAGVLPHLVETDDIYEVAARDAAMRPTAPPDEEATGSPDGVNIQPATNTGAEAASSQSVQQSAAPSPRVSPLIEQIDAVIEHQLYQAINGLLARRYHSQPAAAGSAPQPGLTNLLDTLQQTATDSIVQPTPYGTPAQPRVEQARAALEEEVTQLSNAEKKDGANASATTIDLIGLLFKHILDDAYIPDSIKALLGHLHTPYLKMALLDDQFFVGDENPARRLLNMMSDAGSRCNADDASDHSIITKIQATVKRILEEFDQNTELFTELLDDFSQFMDTLTRRSSVVEQRSVKTVENQQRLVRARQQVSAEMIDRCVAHAPPKPIQDLLLNPWANFLIITLLRNGENSEQWRRALAETDDLIWSVQPKKNNGEKIKLFDKIPDINVSVQTNLQFIGLPPADIETIEQQIGTYHKAVLQGAARFGADAEVRRPPHESRQTAIKRLSAQLPKEWAATVDNEMVKSEAEFQNMTRELKNAAARLKNLPLGTWLEFNDIKSGQTVRGKLAWTNPDTLSYLFVNQSGRQIAVKSRYHLATEIVRGETRILPIQRTPLITRALKSIHQMLQKESDRLSERPKAVGDEA